MRKQLLHKLGIAILFSGAYVSAIGVMTSPFISAACAETTSPSGDPSEPGATNGYRQGGSANPDSLSADTSSVADEAMQYLINFAGTDGPLLPTRCSDYVSGRIASAKGITDRTRQLLEAAQGYLAPGFDPGGRQSGIYLLADYQEELEAEHPDPQVAASYLGLVSTRPVTAQVVGTVNAILCVTSSVNLAEMIAAQAEELRAASR